MPNVLQRTIVRISSTRLGVTLMRPLATRLDPLVFRWSDGRFTATSIVSGLPIVTVQVRGRKSGKLRSVPLVAVPHLHRADAFYLVASNWGEAHYPAWYFNLKAAGEASCTLHGKTSTYTATELEGEAYAPVWSHVAGYIPNFSRYRRHIAEQRSIPIFEMLPG